MGVVGVAALAAAASVAGPAAASAGNGTTGAVAATATPIRHLVVIYQENVSFDHYFGTYPKALNPAGAPAFHARPGTPTVNGLTGALLTHNPNLSNPQRLDRSQAVTCDQNHDYTPEQNAVDRGAMDRFVQDTGAGLTVEQCAGTASGRSPNYAVMDYYDGNTVTAMWNYAQHFAMSDNSYSTGYGPSTPGALNLVAGNTYGAVCGLPDSVYGAVPACPALGAGLTGHSQGPGTVYGDPDPAYDVCSGSDTAAITGANVGDLLNRAGVTWGWFEGGFSSPGYVPGRPSTFQPSAVCTSSHTNIAGDSAPDYSPHHEPFQYYRATANPHHLPPTSVAMIGRQDRANHQYDLADFWAAARSGNLPAVSFLKAAKYQDGHAGYSDPIDEQHFLVDTLNRLQRLPEWRSTAVVIAYDDSDGWYDHQMAPVVTGSRTPLDTLNGPGRCGPASQVPQSSTGAAEQARCGYGMRQPLLVVSPFARADFVDHSLSDQSSILRLVEDNWRLGRVGSGSADRFAGSLLTMFDFAHATSRLILDPGSGEPAG